MPPRRCESEAPLGFLRTWSTAARRTPASERKASGLSALAIAPSAHLSLGNSSGGHSFRQTLSDLLTDHTADPRVAADQLGLSDIQNTLRHYVSRAKAHPKVAAMLDNVVRGKRPAAKKSTSRHL